jgi:uncharacterized membrane protein YGL010W
MREWFIEQLAMYSAYHRDRRNQATHHVGVPLIVYALLVALTQLPVAGPVTAATVLLAALLGFYLLNVPLVGAIATVIYGILYTLAVKVGAEDIGFVWTTFAVCFIGGWAIQFIGHVFEGRRPALFDNAVQVFMAPPFLIAEMLFAAGLEQGLARDIARRQTRYARG